MNRLLLAGVALALTTRSSASQPPPITIAVGETVSWEVGFAVGALCDDPSIVRAEVRSVSPQMNVFVATGLSVGRTLCRAGNQLGRPSVLFDIEVIAGPVSE